MHFSRQSHRGGSNENPTVNHVPYNTTTLVQQQLMYHDLKTMNVEAGEQITYSITASSKTSKKTTMHTNKPKLHVTVTLLMYATVSVSMSFLFLSCTCSQTSMSKGVTRDCDPQVSNDPVVVQHCMPRTWLE